MTKGRLFIIHQDGTPYGPFDWKLVRFLHALGLIDGYYVNEAGTETVIFPSESPKLIKQPEWTNQYLTHQDGSGFTKSQREIFDLLGLPPFTASGHRYVGNKILSIIDQEELQSIDPKLLWRAQKESFLGWKNEPASNEQKRAIEEMDILYRDELTKGEASCLIGNPATEAQYRRLAFYGIAHIQNITKREAAELIDDFKSAFPDSEDEYQASKQQTSEPVANKNSQGILSRMLNRFR